MAELARRIQSIASGNSTGPVLPSLSEIQRQRTERQMAEVASVLHDADAIEVRYKHLGLPFPTIINVFTAGFDKPDGTKQVGVCGDAVFAGFPSPDIYGHEGTISALGETTYVNGRAHPNEWTGREDGSMIVAHPLQVWKEIARRQRANGIEPLFVLTYLVGVREGHALKPGDVGLIMDDMELTNINHPGHGPRGILDDFFGPRFESKAGRAANIQIAKAYADFALANGYGNIFPATVCGTPGTTEYQSFLEAGLLDAAFEQAKAEKFGGLAVKVFGADRAAGLSLLFGMGPTAELATLRQTFPGEEDFKVLALGLATDSVGGEQSLTVDHPAVVAKAFAAGAAHRDRLLQFEKTYNPRLAQPLPDYSIRAKILNDQS